MLTMLKLCSYLLCIISICLLLVPGLNGNNKVCLQWTCEHGNLTFFCEVSNLTYTINIKNQYNIEQAFCQTFLGITSCTSFNKNGSIVFNKSTNQAIYTVIIQDKPSANGKWSCSHGPGEQDPRKDVKVNIGCLPKDPECPPDHAEEEKGDCPMIGSITTIAIVASYIIVTLIFKATYKLKDERYFDNCSCLQKLKEALDYEPYVCLFLIPSLVVIIVVNHIASGNCLVIYIVSILFGVLLGIQFAIRLHI